MKKIILVAALVLGFATAAVAQPRAIGLRGGFGAGVSYQHTVGANFIDAELGFGQGLNVAASYNWVLVQPQWTSRGDWGVYAGPGVALGLGFGDASHLNLGVSAQVGLEYSFWFPLQLSLDVRPGLGFVTAGGESGFGFWGFYPALGVRYKF